MDPRIQGKINCWKSFVIFSLLIAVGSALLIVFFNTPLTEWLVKIDSTWLFLIAIVVAVGSGFGLGAAYGNNPDPAVLRPADLPVNVDARI